MKVGARRPDIQLVLEMVLADQEQALDRKIVRPERCFATIGSSAARDLVAPGLINSIKYK